LAFAKLVGLLTCPAALGVSIWKSLQAPFDNIEKKIQKHSLEIERAFAVEHMMVTTTGMCVLHLEYVVRAFQLNSGRI
jgi:hypothetical protein